MDEFEYHNVVPREVVIHFRTYPGFGCGSSIKILVLPVYREELGALAGYSDKVRDTFNDNAEIRIGQTSGKRHYIDGLPVPIGYPMHDFIDVYGHNLAPKDFRKLDPFRNSCTFYARSFSPFGSTSTFRDTSAGWRVSNTSTSKQVPG
jgi:hypothetical protein